jgi:uncharacterized protein (TIGR00369 family)
MHAGAVTSIADGACGYAALSMAPAGSDVLTAEFNVNSMRPAIGKRFLSVGRVVSAGKSLTVCSGEVRASVAGGDSFKVIALMQATVVFLPRGGE